MTHHCSETLIIRWHISDIIINQPFLSSIKWAATPIHILYVLYRSPFPRIHGSTNQFWRHMISSESQFPDDLQHFVSSSTHDAQSAHVGGDGVGALSGTPAGKWWGDVLFWKSVVHARQFGDEELKSSDVSLKKECHCDRSRSFQ